jgi:hypothetical protein
MRESARRKAAARKARSRRLVLVGAAAVLVTAATVGIVALAGGSDEHKASACVIVDVSESTDHARASYGDQFSRFATSIGLEGSGEICVIFAAADPLAESLVEPLFVGPALSKKGGLEEVSDVERKVANADAELEERMADPTIRERGSGLLEAATEAAKSLHPGDRLLFLSDGLQWTPHLHLQQLDLIPGEIATLLDELEAEGLVPDLGGVEIEFPYLLFHPGGLDDEEARQIISFWEEWAARAGATITVREPIEP